MRAAGLLPRRTAAGASPAWTRRQPRRSKRRWTRATTRRLRSIARAWLPKGTGWRIPRWATGCSSCGSRAKKDTRRRRAPHRARSRLAPSLPSGSRCRRARRPRLYRRKRDQPGDDAHPPRAVCGAHGLTAAHRATGATTSARWEP